MARTISIPNWDKFQQYKDRRPTWIKLLVEIIDEFDADGNPKKFHKMPDSAKLTFILLACLRANYTAHIPYPNIQWLKKRLGIRNVSLQPLVANGFIEINDAAVRNAYAPRTDVYESGTPEGEGETEKEGEGDARTRAHAREKNSNWLAIRHRLASLFPDDQGVENFVRWLSLQMIPKAEGEVKRICGSVWSLLDKAETKDNPVAWFMGAVKQPVNKGGFGYRPTGRKRKAVRENGRQG